MMVGELAEPGKLAAALFERVAKAGRIADAAKRRHGLIPYPVERRLFAIGRHERPRRVNRLGTNGLGGMMADRLPNRLALVGFEQVGPAEDHGVCPAKPFDWLAQRAARKHAAETERLQGVEQDDVAIAGEPAMLKAVVEHDRLAAKPGDGFAGGCDAIGIFKMRHVGQQSSQFEGFVVRLATFGPVASAHHGRSNASLMKPLGDPADHRRLARAAQGEIAHAYNRNVHAMNWGFSTIVATISPTNRRRVKRLDQSERPAQHQGRRALPPAAYHVAKCRRTEHVKQGSFFGMEATWRHELPIVQKLRVNDNLNMKFWRMKMSGMISAVVVAWTAATAAAGPGDQAFHQATHALRNGDLAAAIQQLDEAVRLEPKQASFRGLRGVAWLRKGDYEKGEADLKAAIALNPGDAGAKYQPSSAARLSPQALDHGRRQIEQMLNDRPAMADFGPEAVFLRDWAVRKFAGEDFGELIDWDPSPPWHSDAEHLAPGDGEHAAILVEPVHALGPNEGKPRSFEELWAGAVYELHNVNFAREYVRLNDEAEEGSVSKRAFVGGILKHELAAAQQTRAFYVQVFLPWAEKNKLKTDPTLWFCAWWDSPDAALKSFPDKSAYPWHPYGRTHDWATVHHRCRHGQFDKAESLLRRMLDEEGYEDEQYEVWCWIGRCLAKLDKPADAVAAFSKAIVLDPDSSAAYRARAEQYEKLGEKAKAADDAAKAKELE